MKPAPRQREVDREPSALCYCGGHICWTEYDDRYEGTCVGRCGSYLTKHKAT